MKQDGFSVSLTSFGSSIRELSALNKKSDAENLLSFARTTLTNPSGSGLIDIMPPASQGQTGLGARYQGEAAISRDLSRVFAGVKLKHERREANPDPESIHLRLLLTKRPGAPLRLDRAQKYFVDIRKLQALRRTLLGHVGRLSSALLVSAHRLGVKAPAWIERHGEGPGECNVQLQGPSKEIEIAMHARDNAPVGEIERRFDYALKYTEGRVSRAIEGALTANARTAGFKAA